jgi:hypothetical protein
MSADCELCATRSGVYQFKNICCRVRFLLGEPRREVRVAWIERWRRFDPAAAKEIEEQVKALWPQRRFGK